MRSRVTVSVLLALAACHGTYVPDLVLLDGGAHGDVHPGADGQVGDGAGGDLAVGDPSLGDPHAGDPFDGDPSVGDPSLGDPSAGDPLTCTPGTVCNVASGPCDVDDLWTGSCSCPDDKASDSTACDDGIVCNGTDTCDGNGTCVHSGPPLDVIFPVADDSPSWLQFTGCWDMFRSNNAANCPGTLWNLVDDSGNTSDWVYTLLNDTSGSRVTTKFASAPRAPCDHSQTRVVAHIQIIDGGPCRQRLTLASSGLEHEWSIPERSMGDGVWVSSLLVPQATSEALDWDDSYGEPGIWVRFAKLGSTGTDCQVALHSLYLEIH